MLRASDHYLIELQGKEVRMDRVSSVLDIMASPALYKWQEKVTKLGMVELAKRLVEEIGLENLDQEVQVEPSHFARSLEKNAKDLHAADQIAAERATEGTHLHNFIEWYFKKELGRTMDPEPKYENENVNKLVAKWLDWRNHTQIIPVHIEPVVFSQKLLCAGTTDLVAKVGKNKVLMCVDWKTSKAIWPKHILQCATYVGFTWECKVARPKCGMVIRCGQNGPVEEEEVDPWREHYDIFIALLKAYRWAVKMEDLNRIKWDRKKKNIQPKMPIFDESQPAPTMPVSPGLLPGMSDDLPLF